MMRFLGIFSSIISLFTLSWCLSRWLGPQHCINSSLVSKVVMEPGHEITQACDPMVQLTAPAVTYDLIKTGLVERLDHLETMRAYVGATDARTQITINRQAQNQVLFQPGEIVVSYDQAMVPGLVERALLYQHFSGETDFAAAVKSDFLWGQFVTHGPIESQMWTSALSGMNGYCHSDHVLLAHRAYCTAHNEYNDSFITDYELGPTPWSLVPYFVSTIRRLYEEQPLDKKDEFLKNLIFLSEPESSAFDHWPQISSLKKLDDVFLVQAKNFLIPLMLPAIQVDRAIGETLFNKKDSIDYVVIGRSARETFASDIWQGQVAKQVALAQTPTIIELGLQKYFYPSDIGFNIGRSEIVKQHKIRNLAYISCEVPEIDNLLDLQSVSAHVTYVRDCDSHIDWSAAFSQGLPNYLSHHLEIEFIEFNISALRLAKRLNGTLRDVENISAWQRWLKWQKVVADDEPTISRPLAVIDGVRRFRITH